VLWRGGAGPALLPVPVLRGLRDAADACGGTAHRVVPAVAELRQAGRAGVSRAVAWRGGGRGRGRGGRWRCYRDRTEGVFVTKRAG